MAKRGETALTAEPSSRRSRTKHRATRESCSWESIRIPARIGGVPFSNNKIFWYLLNQAGLLKEGESDLRNDESLKAIYDKKFLPEYELNFVNLVDRPTIDVTELKKGEAEAGIRRALRIIRTCKPRVVCFIGKVAFNAFYRSRKCDWGWQTDVEGVPVYLMHFPIRDPASVRVKELKELERASRIK